MQNTKTTVCKITEEYVKVLKIYATKFRHKRFKLAYYKLDIYFLS